MQDGVCIIPVGPEKQTGRRSQGVAIVLGQEGFECWKAAGFEVHKDLGARIIALRLLIEDSKNNQVGLFLVSAYAPVGKEDDSVWERYLGNLNLCISRKRAGDLLIIGTDANASIGVSVREDEGVKMWGGLVSPI